MPSAWRIVKSKYAASALDGEGARRAGGRWTSVGRRAVYTSSSVALATLEILVHLESPRLLAAYTLFEVRFPDQLVTKLDPRSLPPEWTNYPAPVSLAAIGDRWLDSAASAVLRVPSAVVGLEFNYVLNPEHRDYRKVSIGPAQPFRVDPRLA
ncbi:MAG: RES family NAD+ phosphorylase [Gemmatimonadales bacterium]|nr:RES family NAD+ phosphorylase [Gemmatimonadales bacterium]